MQDEEKSAPGLGGTWPNVREDNSRRGRLHGTGAALLVGTLLISACSERPRPGSPPQHLLLITVENLRADHVTLFGYDRHTTAQSRRGRPIVLDLDYLATSGVAFARAYSAASDPQISLECLLSGEVPVRAGTVELGSGLARADKTLAQDFAEAGFTTVCFVNSSHLPENREGLNAGFGHAAHFETDEQALVAAVAWLKQEVPRSEHLFVWLHMAGVAPPFDGEPMTDRHSSATDGEGPTTSNADFLAGLEARGVSAVASERQRLNDMYDGRLARVTELLNSFLFLYRNNFGPKGFWEENLIALVSTSGCELAEVNGRVGEVHSLRDEGLQVPIFLSHPASLTGNRILSQPVELQDVTATMRDWFRLGGRGSGSGRSLLALTDSYIKRDFSSHPALSIAADSRGFSLRSERYRLTVRDRQIQLFDLHADPSGTVDVSNAYPQQIADLLKSAGPRLETLGLRVETPNE